MSMMLVVLMVAAMLIMMTVILVAAAMAVMTVTVIRCRLRALKMLARVWQWMLAARALLCSCVA